MVVIPHFFRNPWLPWLVVTDLGKREIARKYHPKSLANISQKSVLTTTRKLLRRILWHGVSSNGNSYTREFPGQLLRAQSNSSPNIIGPYRKSLSALRFNDQDRCTKRGVDGMGERRKSSSQSDRQSIEIPKRGFDHKLFHYFSSFNPSYLVLIKPTTKGQCYIDDDSPKIINTMGNK